MRGISRAEATGGIEPLWHRNKRCPMTHAKRLWSIWQALLSAFAWAFTRPSFRRFAEWITAMAINGEEHTITQSVLALERPADWGSAAGSGTKRSRKRDRSDIVKLGGPADVRAIFNRARHFDFGPPFAGDPWDDRPTLGPNVARFTSAIPAGQRGGLDARCGEALPVPARRRFD